MSGVFNFKIYVYRVNRPPDAPKDAARQT